MRPLLVGMNNPRDPDPARALAPSVPGTAGSRLYEMLRTALPDLSPTEYDLALERTNLLHDVRWSPPAARREVAPLLAALARTPGRVVVPLGREVRDLLRVPREWPWILPYTTSAGWVARCLPHPSGLNRWYNDPDWRQTAGLMLAELAAASLLEQGVRVE